MMLAGWMRRCASFMAMRRISWIDQRIRNDMSPGVASFFWAAPRYWRDAG